MQKTSLQSVWSLLLVLGLFLLSNVSALFTVIWLIPGLVYLEAACWLIVALLCVWSLRRAQQLPVLLSMLAKSWMIVPFLAFSAFSIAWSADWQVSLSRWLVLVASVIAGAYISTRCDMERLVRLLAIFCGLILFLSVIVVVLLPGLGVMNYYTIQGAWKGVFWHKNHMGIITAFATMIFLIGTIGSLQHRARSMWLWGALYVVSLFILLRTDSVGAYITLAVVHGALLLSLAYIRVRQRLRRSHYLLILLVALVIGALVYLNIGRVFSLVNRSSSLTGRVPMWGHLFDLYLSKRPVFGYGFNAFWYIDSHRTTMGIVAGYPERIVIADNGFIDILMNTGYVGLGLFLVFYLGLWLRSIQYAWRAADVYDLFPFAVMTFSLVANVSWSLLFENESFLMLIMLSVMFLMPRTVGEARERSSEPSRGASTLVVPS